MNVSFFLRSLEKENVLVRLFTEVGKTLCMRVAVNSGSMEHSYLLLFALSEWIKKVQFYLRDKLRFCPSIMFHGRN